MDDFEDADGPCADDRETPVATRYDRIPTLRPPFDRTPEQWNELLCAMRETPFDEWRLSTRFGLGKEHLPFLLEVRAAALGCDHCQLERLYHRWIGASD